MTDVGDEFMAPRPFAHPTRDPREKEERLRAVVFAARRLLASLDCRLDDVELMAEKLRYRLDQLGAADEPTTATGGEPS